MKNLTKILTGISLIAGLNLNSYSQNKEVPCVSNKEVEFVISEIPKYFKQKDPITYLIEFVPEAKNGYGFGGQLSVYIPVSVDSAMSIFDRTDINPSKWYSVSNWDSKNKGCVDRGGYLISKKEMNKTDSQKKFNGSISKIKKIIKEEIKWKIKLLD